jgi:hypothetical protein
MALGSFELDIARFVEKAKGNATLVVRRTSLDLLSRVIQKSPVDEGRFKSSWLVSLNAIPEGVPGTIDKSGAPSFARLNMAVAGMKAGDYIAMTSSLAYSRKLEYGHSKQAPSGVVRITVAEFPQVVAKAAAEAPK